ncbi:putative adhesin [Streptomyces vinaceus]|uniref:putative adhesin n=1 Tax=Streptomyces vinaceus TaxID=1960 RepID=UPI0037FAB88D
MSGHSSLDPATRPARVKLPPGVEVRFYQDFLHLLSDGKGREIESLLPEVLDSPSLTFRGVYEKVSEELPEGEVPEFLQECAEGYCWNFTIRPARDVTDIQIARIPDNDQYHQFIPQRETTLGEILESMPGYDRIYWAACLAVELREVGGRFGASVNTGMDGNFSGDSAYVELGELDALARANPHYFEESNVSFQVDALMRRSMPKDSVPIAEVEQVIVDLMQASGKRDLAAKFLAQDENMIRALLMNETTRGWLEQRGMRLTHGSITRLLLDSKDPNFWFPGEDNLDIVGYLGKDKFEKIKNISDPRLKKIVIDGMRKTMEQEAVQSSGKKQSRKKPPVCNII